MRKPAFACSGPRRARPGSADRRDASPRGARSRRRPPRVPPSSPTTCGRIRARSRRREIRAERARDTPPPTRRSGRPARAGARGAASRDRDRARAAASRSVATAGSFGCARRSRSSVAVASRSWFAVTWMRASRDNACGSSGERRKTLAISSRARSSRARSRQKCARSSSRSISGIGGPRAGERGAQAEDERRGGAPALHALRLRRRHATKRFRMTYAAKPSAASSTVSAPPTSSGLCESQ